MMDDLDKQMEELLLLNERDLTPKQQHLQQQHQQQQQYKKIGPAVPPKPKKLQSHLLSNESLQQQQQQQQPHHNVYSNMKLTLDNPAILEQQLEALEHHKKVLENQQRRLNSTGYLTSMGSMKASQTPPPQTSGPQIASQQQPNKLYENHQMLYENMKLNGGGGGGGAGIGGKHLATATALPPSPQPPPLIYSNILHKQRYNNSDLANPYSNMSYDGQSNHDDLPPPPLDIIPPPLNIVDGNYQHYNHLHHHHHHHDNGGSDGLGDGSSHQLDEELPPPPSPVSSSYSELRRATDNHFHHQPQQMMLPNRQLPLKDNQQIYQHLSSAGGGQSLAHNGSNSMGGANGGQRTYINNLPADYAAYAPSLQSFNSDYAGYGGSSQGSSTYESIYEPINPRPPSQMSSRSNYSLYYGNAGVASGQQPHHQNGSQTPVQAAAPQASNHKEAEVDVLTDLLVQSMDGSQDDSYGICVQCNERVVGESSGCTAMEEIYHIACFTCCQCQINLQGKPFYALDGKPCCESDYLNTLEKCSVCMKPILERILRATGKPYHPGCFCCVVCGKSLDGVPFTVDATNQNHCIEDFHKKFAPRCCVCRQPIMPEPGKEETVRVVALDRSFHVACYKCEDCGLLLSSEAEGRGCFPLDDHILCKSCNAKRVQALTSHMTTEL